MDVRGTVGHIPIYQFTPNLIGSDNPYDKLIPFVNDSCVPVLQVSVPYREDKPVATELREAITCTLAKPMRFGDFRGGRAALNIFHIVPVTARHQFPVD